QASNASETVKDNASKMNEFYQNWFNMQMTYAKQLWEMNMNHMKNTNIANNNIDMTPRNICNNYKNQMLNMNNTFNKTNNKNNWMGQMQNMNPMNMDTWKKASENWTGIFNQYYEMMNNSFADMQKNMQNGTAQDAYRNMVNVSEGFTRFAEMWMPMWKS